MATFNLNNVFLTGYLADVSTNTIPVTITVVIKR